MTYILRFLRNLDTKRIIFIIRRMVAALMPLRPYETCGKGACPCPCNQNALPQRVTGIASATESASVHIGLKPASTRRIYENLLESRS